MTTPRPKTGAELITAERQRQIDVEGYTPAHDEKFTSGSLGAAAASYALPPDSYERTGMDIPLTWPWSGQYWKPSPGDRIRELAKAGALIAAEIDRLQRAGVAR